MLLVITLLVSYIGKYLRRDNEPSLLILNLHTDSFQQDYQVYIMIAEYFVRI